jgi:hypothetical protein
VTASRDEALWPGFQGSRLNLEFNRAAAVRLRDALERAINARADSAPVQRVTWQLPDGRPLDVSVRLTDGAAHPDDNDEVTEEPPHGDVSGDFDVHATACGAIAAATGRYARPPRSHEDATAQDLQRIDEALERHLPLCNGAEPLLRDDLRRRAVAAADATRARRVDEATRAL